MTAKLKKMEYSLKRLALGLLCLFGCTQNEMAKNFGGTAQVTLENCEKLVNVTWKEDAMWIVTKPFNETDKPETYRFKENSAYGVWEGTVHLREICNK